MFLDDEEFIQWRANTKKMDFAEAARLISEGHFVATSSHPNWRGKVRCKYCKATGYGGSVERNPLWWGQRHGSSCKHKP